MIAGLPAAAVSSSPSRVTPGRRLANADDPHSRHTAGRVAPHLPHTSTPGSSECDGALAALAPREGAASAARQQPRPSGRVDHADHPTVVIAEVADQRRRQQRAPPRFLVRSVDDVEDRPAVALARRGRSVPPARQCRAVTVGHGDTNTTGTSASRQRSTTTSRACQVGLLSLCNASSCSSITTAAAMPGHGAHAAVRVPITTSTPPAAARPLVGHDRDRQPGSPQPGTHRRVPARAPARRPTSGRGRRRCTRTGAGRRSVAVGALPRPR